MATSEAGYRPLIVTAHLATAYTVADPWSPALDGILAYWALREQLGEEAFALSAGGHGPLIAAELPLAREVWGDDWWWRCSAPQADVAAEFTRHTHRRFDDQLAYDRVPGTVRKVLTAGGPYKAYRNQHVGRVARALVWHCVGDGDAILRLLRRCGNVGRGHTHGYGQVGRWTVEPGGDADLARFGRPLPVAFAAAHGVEGAVLDWGIRPPGRAHRVPCVLPQGDDRDG